MTDRSVVVRLSLEHAQYMAAMKEASRQAKDLAEQFERSETTRRQHMETLSRAMALTGAGMAGFAAIAVKKFADFDKAMSSVKASTRAAGAELQSLRDAAIKAGADTQYSASEAAQAIDELAKAGVSTASILGGGLSGALSLAAAGQLDVAEAAETAASAMTQFNLSGDKVNHVADLLAAGAGKAQGSVHDLGAALNQSGLVAAQTGLSIEEATGGLAAFASAGLTGSDAGTSFKTMLQALTPSSKEAARVMDELGISAYDSQGNFIGLTNFAGNLQDSLAGLSVEQQNATLKTIFGSDAVRAAAILYKQGASGVQEWIDKVNDTGYAAETAATMTDNLSGDIERLGGAIDTAFIKSGSGANDVLRNLVQGAESVVDAIGEIPAPVLNATTLIAGTGGLALLGVAGMGKLAGAAREVNAAVKALGFSIKGASLAAGGVGIALAGVTTAIMAVAGESAKAKERVEALKDTLDDLGEATTATGEAMIRAWQDQQSWFAGLDGERRSVMDIADAYGYTAKQLILMTSGTQEGEAALAALVERQRQAAETREMLQNTSGSDPTVIAAWHAEAEALDDVIKGVRDQHTALTEAEQQKKADAEASRAAGVAQEALDKALRGTTMSIVDQTQAIEDQWEAITKTSSAVLSARDAQRDYEAAIDDAAEALKKNGKTLDINTEKGRANQAALDAIASSGIRAADSMRQNGATQQELSAQMLDTRKRFIDMAVAMEMGRDEAERLADELNLIPNVTTKVTVDAQAALTRAQAVYDAIKNLPTAKYITVGVIDNYSRTAAQIYSATGGMGGGTGITKKALGGPVSGGIPGKDSVPVLAMPGEHMLTVADVNALGGHAGVYALRAALHGGVQAMAAGGAVGYTFGTPSTKGKDAAYWRDAFMDFPERYRLLEQIWKMQTDLADKTGLARQAAEQEISRAETKLSEAEYAATVANGDPRYWDGVVAAQAEAKKKDEAAQESAGRRADTARDIGTSMRRGEYVSQATSGLSGAYGLVDTLYAQSRNTDLSASSQKSLAGAAAAAEGQFTSLYAQLDKVNAAVDEQSDLVGDLQRAYDQVKNAISGAFDLQGVARQQDQLVSAAQSAREKADALKNDVVYEAHTNEQGETYYTSRLSDEAVQAEKDAQAAEKAAAGAGTGASYLKAAQEYAGKVQTLAGKIQALVKRGVPTRIIQEILAFGVDGGAIDAATAIGSLSDADLGKLTTAYQQIDAYSGQIGQYTTATMAAGGLAGQSSVLTGLQGQASGLEAQIAGVGKAVEDAIATAFGLPKRAAGGPTVPGQTYWVGERGPELWTSAASGFVLDAATSRNLAMATPAGGYGAGRYGQAAPQVTKTYSATVNTLQATPAQVLAAVKQAELQDVMP